MGDPIIKVSAILEKIDMPYCLIGGYAVAAYGAPRYTAEVNFLVSRLKDYCGHLQANLQEENLPFEFSRADLLDPVIINSLYSTITSPLGRGRLRSSSTRGRIAEDPSDSSRVRLRGAILRY
ncbi:MAG: hypothetical protein PWR22_491 [Moorella sp. (in: firmicutes)]|jgi:hypothetical protein|nr:hypothetical protein [Moorella sp. (in: firmicutes)]MDK2893909.1 hypothetical protein [Moorella sp. (in: firmicutes)]GEA13865.1 hypothetical protein E308F_01050 [Moorella sp. E308F]GEA18763.1 hypothetical protein E306M_19000 [Moorella sp. E306M]